MPHTALLDHLQSVLPAQRRWPLFDSATSRRIEQQALQSAAPHALMARAGLAVARLALAVAPGARRVWIACGPGNNGGDGLIAALHLQSAGWQVEVALLGDNDRRPADAANALQQAQQAGVRLRTGLQPASDTFDLAIDALLGLGQRRAPEGAIAAAVQGLNAGTAPVLAVDLPTGLCGDTGRLLGADVVRARHTLALLTLKPGLFTGHGRDHAGRVWLDDLGLAPTTDSATAWLGGPDALAAALPGRAHAQHKGSFGDVLVLGGAPGMGGAALLAAGAALTAGAGRTMLARLDGDMQPDPQRPELMPRTPEQAQLPDLLQRTTVVCGCGGGQRIADTLPAVLDHAARLVLDADALNAVAADADLRRRLRARADRGLPTVLTPHPLEAARLLGCSTADVQANRLAQAQALADGLQAVVVLKGSGSAIAAPGRLPQVNASGNARLGSGGSGDVLAGWLGGLWAQAGGGDGSGDGSASAFDVSAAAVWLHGRAAEQGDLRLPLRAADLIDAMAASLRR